MTVNSNDWDIMRIQLHPSLKRFADGQTTLTVDDGTVATLLDAIKMCAPLLYKNIIDNSGAIRPYVQVYINQQSYKDCSPTQYLSHKDEIDIITSLVGG